MVHTNAKLSITFKSLVGVRFASVMLTSMNSRRLETSFYVLLFVSHSHMNTFSAYFTKKSIVTYFTGDIQTQPQVLRTQAVWPLCPVHVMIKIMTEGI